MRPILLLVVLCAFNHLKGQTLLPSFPSAQPDGIEFDSLLKASPKEYLIITRKYDKSVSKLVDEELTINYTIGTQLPEQVEFFLHEKKFLTVSYDSYGRVIKHQRENHITPIVDYLYNDKERISTEIKRRANGTTHSQSICQYDSHNHLISKKELKGEDELLRYWSYSYDEQGNIETESYADLKLGDSNMVLETIYENYYNEKSHLRRVDITRKSIIQSRTNYQYYPDSTTIRTIMYEQDGTPAQLEFELKYDSLKVQINGYFEQGDTSKFRSRFREIYLFGDLIEFESRTLSGTYVERFATFYEYDDMGNWIKKITYNNGVPLKEEIRKINY